MLDSDGIISISVSQTSQVNSQKPETEGKILRVQESGDFNQVYLRITSISKSMIVFIHLMGLAKFMKWVIKNISLLHIIG